MPGLWTGFLFSLLLSLQTADSDLSLRLGWHYPAPHLQIILSLGEVP